jgi:hypothetical protein
VKELKIYKSPWNAIKLLVGCSMFVALGFFLLREPNTPRWVAWLSIGFFGLCLPVGLFQLFDRRPQIIVNELGIFDRTTHRNFINWEIIQDAYLVEIHKQPFICLIVDEAFEPSRTKGKFGRSLAQLNKAMGFQELNITLGYVSVNAERLAEFILAMRSAEKPERVFLVEKAIANL